MFSRIKAYLLRRLCGHPRSHSLDKSALNSFVLLRYDRIGDLIVSLPLAKALKTQYPNATLALIASQSNAPVARESGLFSDIHVKPKNIIKWILLLRGLRGRFDVVVDLNHSVAPHAIFAILTMNPKHVASPYKAGRWGVPGCELGLFDIMPRIRNHNTQRSIAEVYLDIARLLDCPIESCFPYPLPRRMADANKTLTILLNHQGSSPEKSLRDDDLLRISALTYRLDPSIKIVMTPMERSHSHLRALFQSVDNVVVMSPADSIKQTMAVASKVDLIITPDTSLVHLACAYSKPLVAVYASHREFYEHWKPINEAPTKVLFSSHPKKLEGYSSDQLIEACADMIQRLSQTPKP